MGKSAKAPDDLIQLSNPQTGHFHFSNIAEFSIIAGCWSLIALLTITQESFDPRFLNREHYQESRVLYTLTKYLIWALATPGILTLIRLIARFKSGWAQFPLHIAIGLGVSAAIHLSQHMLWNFYYPELNQSTYILDILEGLHFLPEFFLYLVVLAAGLAHNYFLRYQERMQETAILQAKSTRLQIDAADLRAQLADARLQTLHMQINPHFLFNTLHMISAYIERDPEGSRRILTLLSEMLRYSLEKTDIKEVPLSQELAFLDKYLEIQSIRFQGQLEINRNIDPAICDALVPIFILQPLIENAIKHGISAIESPGRIDLNIWLEKDRLHVSVHDNGPGLTGSSGATASSEDTGKGTGIGLKNVQNRLATLYPDAHSMTLKNDSKGGAVAHLSLPYYTSADLVASLVEV